MPAAAKPTGPAGSRRRGRCSAPARPPGNSLPLKVIPVGTVVHNEETGALLDVNGGR